MDMQDNIDSSKQQFPAKTKLGNGKKKILISLCQPRGASMLNDAETL